MYYERVEQDNLSTHYITASSFWNSLHILSLFHLQNWQLILQILIKKNSCVKNNPKGKKILKIFRTIAVLLGFASIIFQGNGLEWFNSFDTYMYTGIFFKCSSMYLNSSWLFWLLFTIEIWMNSALWIFYLFWFSFWLCVVTGNPF